MNLKDSGATNLAVALREGSSTAKKVEADGLKVMTVAEAAAWADVMMMLRLMSCKLTFTTTKSRQTSVTAQRLLSHTA